jgi:hypothetical protein
MSSVTTKYKIEDKQVNEALKEVEKIAGAGKNGNFQVMSKGITKSDAGQLKEGVRYVDGKNKRTVVKIDGELFYTDMVKLV